MALEVVVLDKDEYKALIDNQADAATKGLCNLLEQRKNGV